MASIAKLKLMAIGGLAGGAVLTFFAILTPTTFEPNSLVSKSQSTTALTADNAASWTTIPGTDDIQITWSHTLYQIDNAAAVSPR